MSARDASLEARLSSLDTAQRYSFLALDVVDSTNTYLKAMAAQGASEWSVVTAAAQTAGRGRLGRSFFSPSATGLYISVLIKPCNSVFRLEAPKLITVAAAIAAARAIEGLSGRKTQIKWVNDIYIDGKKVSGILAEGIMGANGLESVVVGTGVNLFEPKGGFPDEIADRAAYVFEGCHDAENRRAELAKAILDEFYELYARLGEREYMREYRERSYLTGSRVEFEHDGKMAGVVKDIDDDAALIVALDDGKEVRLSAGEVSVKKQSRL